MSPLVSETTDRPTDLARRLVLEYGWNSTSHQVLDPGMSHWFSLGRDAVVGYVEVAGMRVVAGAPVAADDRLAAVAKEFEDDSLAVGRQVCYFAAENRLLAQVKHRRYARHLIGLQPTWSAESWGRRFDASASLRAQRNRAVNKGVRVVEVDAGRERDHDLRDCHAAWLAAKGLPRLGFLAHSDLSHADAGTVADRRLFVATVGPGVPGAVTTSDASEGDADDGVIAYLSAAPVPRRRGWLVEKIVRRPSAPNGTTELLLDTALRALAVDAERFTLGLSPLIAKAEEKAVAPTARLTSERCVEVAERLAVKRGHRLYDFGGLYSFKRKFRPEAWEPVYLLSTQEQLTPRTFLALAGAFLGAGKANPYRGWWSMPS